MINSLPFSELGFVLFLEVRRWTRSLDFPAVSWRGSCQSRNLKMLVVRKMEERSEDHL
jgi:hypothetical protein